MTTDFGLKDHYTAEMKGVILRICPTAKIVDITHQIEKFNIKMGAYTLASASPYFPKNTIHLVVVDPGVGTERRPIIIQTKHSFYVGPDNGVLTLAAINQGIEHIYEVANHSFMLRKISSTFHGRDIFAPVAAHLSRGADPLEMGPGITDPVPLEVPSPQQRGDIMTGQVMRVDHFGNLITNIQRKELELFLESRRPVIRAGKLAVEGMSKSYGEALSGEALALIGSSDYLEIAVNLGRACDVTGMNTGGIVGMEIEVSRS